MKRLIINQIESIYHIMLIISKINEVNNSYLLNLMPIYLVLIQIHNFSNFISINNINKHIYLIFSSIDSLASDINRYRLSIVFYAFLLLYLYFRSCLKVEDLLLFNQCYSLDSWFCSQTLQHCPTQTRQ